MPLKNYSTTIAPEKSIGEIQAELRKVKVRGVSISYGEDGEPHALSFDVETLWGMRSYLLPADVDGVQRVLVRQIGANRAGSTRAQAIRVAWRLAKDWVTVQIAYIQAGAASFEQIMLPYMQTDGADGPQTVFEVMRDRYQKALPAAKSPTN